MKSACVKCVAGVLLALAFWWQREALQQPLQLQQQQLQQQQQQQQLLRPVFCTSSSWLSRKGDQLMMKGDEPGKRTGPNTLEDMHAKAFAALGGIAKRITSKTKRPAKERDQYGMLRNRTVTEDLGINEIAPDGKSEAAFGIGSHRIRTISAKEAMDTHGVSASRRVDLMRDYAGRMADGKVTLSKDDPTIQQLRTLEKRISKLEESTPKELVKGIGPKGAVTAENPKRAEIDSLKGQYTEAITKLAEKLGVEPKEGMTTASLADA
mgnify:CR=1 FL=1